MSRLMVRARTFTPSIPGIHLMLNTYAAWSKRISAGHEVWFNVTDWPESRAMPAGFQYTAVASSASATYASPIAAARAPTPIFSDWPPRVPTFSNICAPSAVSGRSRQTATINVRMTECLLDSPGTVGNRRPFSSDDDESADLLAQLRVDRVEVNAAHD